LSYRFISASKPLPHLSFNLFVLSGKFATILDPVLNRFKRQTLPTVNMKHFFMNILCIDPFVRKKAQDNAAFL
jgi:hypothetical protein